MAAAGGAAPPWGVAECTELSDPKLSCDRDIGGRGESAGGGAAARSAVRGAEGFDSVGAARPSAVAYQFPGTCGPPGGSRRGRYDGVANDAIDGAWNSARVGVALIHRSRPYAAMQHSCEERVPHC
jgi:hypothetical protein